VQGIRVVTPNWKQATTRLRVLAPAVARREPRAAARGQVPPPALRLIIGGRENGTERG
jgi:hypothetical protein